MMSAMVEGCALTREDIDELADRTCKLLDLVADPERGDSKA